MKSVVFREPNRFVVEDRPVPDIGDGDALVKVRACGICGTDVHILHGEHIVKFPVVPGHEFSGEVVKVGSKVSDVSVGDRVTIDPNIVDYTCYFCRRGQIHLCENLTALGVNYDGGFAEFCRVPAVQAYKVPDSVSLDEAAMAEPLACCIHGIDRANITPGDSVVVLGAGSIGLLLVQLARIAGASHIIVSEPDERKRHMAARFGSDAQVDPSKQDVTAEVAELTKVGADVVIESAGRLETAQLALKLARRGGTVLQFGVVSPDQLAEVSPYDVYYNELTVRGSFVNPYTHARAIKLLASKQVEVMPLITHRFTLDESAKAFETAQSKDAVKVLLVPE
ncbi:MAG TPA: zinc-dependent alcohol dehydrogenase family protein [Armatimonadota bacterium]|nr:zinc-dependent alcohol dehydrogenase family protein [Armatimonadota bacterium]